MNSRHLTILIAACVCLCSALCAGETHPIRISRPDRVGQVYRLQRSGSISEKVVMTVNGQDLPQADQAFGFAFDGTAEIMAVDAASQTATHMRLTVTSFTKTAGLLKVDILKQGQIIEALLDETGKRFMVDGEAADGETTKLLALVIDLASANDDAADAIYGHAEPKSAGDQWPINTEAALAQLAKNEITAEADNVSGQTIVKTVATHDTVPCLEIDGTIRVEGARPALPPGFAVQSSLVEMKLTGAFPVDVTEPLRQRTFLMHVSFVASGQPGPDMPPIPIKADIRQTINETRSYRKKP